MTRWRITAAAAAAVMVASAPAVQAATLGWPDRRGDALPRYDLTSVTYTNSSSVVSARALVANLRLGRAMFGFNLWPGNGHVPDALYYATTRMRGDGSVTARLMLFTDVDSVRVDCDIRAQWRPARDTVRLWFPQACLHWHSGIRVSAFLGDPRVGDPADSTGAHNVPLD